MFPRMSNESQYVAIDADGRIYYKVNDLYVCDGVDRIETKTITVERDSDLELRKYELELRKLKLEHELKLKLETAKLEQHVGLLDRGKITFEQYKDLTK